MKVKTYKDVTAVGNENCFGIRIMCNLSPEEMEERKEEIMKKLFDHWDWKCCAITTPEGRSCSMDLDGFWYYMVEFMG